MAYLPIFVRLDGCRCVVIGGGEVAERKVATLLEAQARVCVVSPTVTSELRRLANANAIEYLPRAWKPGDLEGCTLAFAATDDRQLHRAIADEARSRRVPINVADEPELCDFITPSVVHRGDLKIAISTSGASPALASRIRRDLEVAVGPEYETVTQILRGVRAYLRERESDAARRTRILQAIAFSDIASRIREEDWPAVDRLLVRHLGIALDRLGINPKALAHNREVSL